MVKAASRGKVKVIKTLKKYIREKLEPDLGRKTSSELNEIFTAVPYSESFLLYKPGDKLVSVVVLTSNKQVIRTLKKRGFKYAGAYEKTISVYRSENQPESLLPRSVLRSLTFSG